MARSSKSRKPPVRARAAITASDCTCVRSGGCGQFGGGDGVDIDDRGGCGSRCDPEGQGEVVGCADQVLHRSLRRRIRRLSELSGPGAGCGTKPLGPIPACRRRGCRRRGCRSRTRALRLPAARGAPGTRCVAPARQQVCDARAIIPHRPVGTSSLSILEREEAHAHRDRYHRRHGRDDVPLAVADPARGVDESGARKIPTHDRRGDPQAVDDTPVAVGEPEATAGSVVKLIGSSTVSYSTAVAR